MNAGWATEPLGSQLATVLEAAIAAPSVHNTQPWRFRLRPNHIDILLDQDRRLSMIDPDGREAYISVGAALLNLRIAALSAGRVPLTLLQPSPTEPDLLASVTLGGPHRPDASVRALASAIGKRRTNRRPFRDIEVRAEVIDQLEAAAHAEGATLVTADPNTRTALLSLVRTAHDQQQSHAHFESAPTMVAIYTVGDTPLHWLRAGQAMERVLLTATVRGVSNTPMTAPTEMPELRTLLSSSDDPRVVQIILRLGYGDPCPATPRRPLSDVITAATTSTAPGD